MTLLADSSSAPTEGSEAADKPVPAVVDFDTAPDRYRHWSLSVDGPVATLTLAVDEQGGLVPGYELKMNSYDLGVDIELYDAVQRLRFEHPEVRAVVMTGGLDRMFCAGANIRMLAQSSHAWKVNFCKFTNETRNGIEDATASSGQTWIAALNGTAAGGGYELALACDEIVLVDDGSSAVSLPEVPLLGVLPGTGGLTRVVDKRHVRKDRADVFATKTEGARGATAVDWGLVDETVPRSRFADAVRARAEAAVERSGRSGERGVALTPLSRTVEGDTITYPHVQARLDRVARRVDITVHGPDGSPPADAAAALEQGVDLWHLALARELDHLVLHLRTNELELGTWVLRTRGERRGGPGARRAARGARGRLVRRRGPPLPQAHAQAPRRHQPQPDRGRRAGQLLRRNAARAGPGLRPSVHARRRARGGPARHRRGRRRRRARRRQRERRPLPDGQRPVPPAVALPRPRRPARAPCSRAPASRWTPRPRSTSAWSRSRPTTSTGRRSCASRSRSAPRCRPTP